MSMTLQGINAPPHPWRNARGFLTLGGILYALVITMTAAAQSLDERLDEDQFLRAVCELRLPEVLERYVATHPTDDAVRRAQFEIARLRIALHDPEGTSEHRLAAIERIVQVRGEMVAQRPADERRAVWLADQAGDLFFEMLPIDAAGLTALAGVPSPTQHLRVSHVADQMNQLTEQAELDIVRVVQSLESAPGFAADLALQQKRTRLTEQERDRRIPFLRGIGAFLQAEFNERDARRRATLYARAADLLVPLPETLEGPLAAQARVYAGLALMRAGKTGPAEAMFKAAIGAEAVPPADLLLAQIGEVMNIRASAGPAAALETLNALESSDAESRPVFTRLLFADQRFLLRREIARNGPPDQRTALLREAYATYTDLLNTDLGVPRETMRAVVFEKLVNATDEHTPLAELPAIVSVARADRLSQAEDSESRRAAVALCDDVLQRADLNDFERSAAMFSRARALFGAGQMLGASRGFLDLARQHTADEQAHRAVEFAASIAANALRADPADAAARALLREALEVAMTRYPNLPSIDRWRYAAGRLALEERRLDDAEECLAQVSASAPQWPEAQYTLALIAVERAARANDEADRASLNEAVVQTIDRVRPVVDEAASHEDDPARSALLRTFAAMLRVHRAQALVNLNRAQQAIDSLKDFEKDSAGDRAVLGEGLRVRITALQALNRSDAAAKEIERFVEAAPQQAAATGAMMDAMQREINALLDAGKDAEAGALAQRTILPVAQLVEERLANAGLSAADEAALMRRVADAFRAAGECGRAIAIYERLLARQPDSVALLAGRAECLYALAGPERLAEAMTIYKRLAAAGPGDQPGSQAAEPSGVGRNAEIATRRLDLYWLAQLRMLQILDQVSRNTNQIVPRIERLRQQDAEFGGERWRRGFEILRNKWAGKG